MTNRLENEANLWRSKGYQRVAQALDLAFDLAIDASAPESFPDEIEPVINKQQKVDVRQESNISLQTLLDALYLEPQTEGKGLTAELTRHFNKSLGSKLPDNTLLEKLRMPTLTIMRLTDDLDQTKVEFLKKNGLDRSLSMALNALARSGFFTAGDIRNASPSQMMGIRQLGAKSYIFFKDGLRRSPQSEQD